MFDLYLVVTPLFGLLSLLTLLNLKLTLTQPKTTDLWKYQAKVFTKQTNSTQNKTLQDQTVESGYKKTWLYLLKNYTIADFCFIRRSRNKILFLLSISIQAILSILFTSKLIYVFSCVGFTIVILFIMIKMIVEPKKKELQFDMKQKDCQKQIQSEKSGQKIEILITALSLLINLAIIWLVFKNTKNVQLMAAAYNFVIILSMDNLLIKPLLFTLLAFPLKFCQFSNDFIEKQIQIVQILHGQRVLSSQLSKKAKRNESKKVHNSTSNTENTFEIEPCVNFDFEGNNLSHSKIEDVGKLQKSHLNHPKSGQIIQQSESSLTKYVNFTFKNTDSSNLPLQLHELQRNQFHSKNLNDSIFKTNSQGLEKILSNKRRNKLYSQKSGPISSQINQIRNYPNQCQSRQQRNLLICSDQVNFNSTSKNPIFQQSQSPYIDIKNHNKAKRVQKSSILHENQNHNPKLKQNQFSDLCSKSFKQTIKTDLLKIRQDKNDQNLAEIDLNSPQRRNFQLRKLQIQTNKQRRMSQNGIDSTFKNNINKIYKKFSLDPNEQIIRKTINQKQGNMDCIQVNDCQHVNWQEVSQKRKKMKGNSQLDLSRKSDIFARFSNDSRMAKSVKRTKHTKDPIVRENDENQIPEFVIEDFAY